MQEKDHPATLTLECIKINGNASTSFNERRQYLYINDVSINIDIASK